MNSGQVFVSLMTGALICSPPPPRASRLRRPRCRDRLVATAPAVEDGDPLAGAVLAQAHLVAPMRHANHDERDARPRVEKLVHQPQLGGVGLDQYGGEGDAEAAAAGVQFPWSGHSMIWSARSSSDGGIVRPRALAVLTLIISSNLAGRSTGRSDGLAPLRILSTYSAARR